MRCAPIRCHSVRYISVSFLFRSFANSKTLAAIVSKNIRCSFSDNAVTSGAPTGTTSSFVFSIFITSSRLFFEGQKKYPSLFRLENGKKQGSKRKILQFFLHTGFFSVSALEIIHRFSLRTRVYEGTLFRIKTVTYFYGH